jgi:hypothetical protein
MPDIQCTPRTRQSFTIRLEGGGCLFDSLRGNGHTFGGGGVIPQLCNKWYYWMTWFNWELNKMKKARTTNLVFVFFKTNVEIVASRTDFRCEVHLSLNTN